MKSPIIKIMEDAVAKVARQITRDFGEVENLQVSRKGPGNFVTSADLRAEETLVRELKKARPDYGFLLEEGGEIIGKDAQHRWVIDPIDGTTNFMHGIPYFCISVALEKKDPKGKGEIIAGIIHSPILNETYYAEKGQGAYLNNRRLGVSARTNMEDAVFGMYIGHREKDHDREKAVMEELFAKSANIRVIGSAALELAYVAAGKLDAFWHNKLSAWDLAAGVLLVREAHGFVSDIHGGDAMLEKGTILASNDSFSEPLRKLLSKYYSATT